LTGKNECRNFAANLINKKSNNRSARGKKRKEDEEEFIFSHIVGFVGCIMQKPQSGCNKKTS